MQGQEEDKQPATNSLSIPPLIVAGLPAEPERRDVSMNMQQIRAKAKELQIAPGSKNKVTLIRTIQEKEGNIPCFKTAITECDQWSCCWRSDCIPGSNQASP